MTQKPTISVIMLAFNHEKFIDQAIQSVISQISSFDFELLIGEDCSTDKTLEKCKLAQTKHPEIIRLISAQSNVGVFRNFQRLIDSARGEYLAILEGDDYWVDDSKLQKQVLFLKAHPEYFWCSSKTQNKEFLEPVRASYSLSDILRRYLFHFSSIIYRSEPKINLPNNLKTNCLDVVLFALLGEESSCGFIDEELSYYRRHEGGIWTGASVYDRLQETWKICDFFLSKYGLQFEREIYERELWIYKQQISHSGKNLKNIWLELGALKSATRKRINETYGNRYLHYQLVLMSHGIKISYLRIRQQFALRRRLENLLGRTRNT